MARTDRVVLTGVAGLLAVEATINGDLRASLVVDTGAARFIISRQVARSLGMDLRNPTSWERLAGVGRSDLVPVVRLTRVQVGGAAVDGILTAVYDLPPEIPADGLLGLSFLSHFRTTFEFDTRVLVLRELPGT